MSAFADLCTVKQQIDFIERARVVNCKPVRANFFFGRTFDLDVSKKCGSKVKGCV